MKSLDTNVIIISFRVGQISKQKPSRVEQFETKINYEESFFFKILNQLEIIVSEKISSAKLG